jgi:hypothetical protein
LITSITVYISERWSPVAIDYAVFWNVTRRADPYRLGLYFVNPPTALAFLEPLRLVAFWPGYALWTVLSIVLFYLAARPLVGGVAAFLSLFSAAAVHGLLLGQAPMLLSAALFAGVSLPSFWCGTIFGGVMALKPQLLVMAPLVLLIRKDWHAIAGILVGAAILIGFSLALFGVQPWFDWIKALPSFNQAVIRLQVLRHVITPASFGPKFGMPMTPFLGIGIVLATILVVRWSRAANGANLIALIVTASVLASPYALPHDLVGAMPAVSAFIISGAATTELVAAVVIFCGAFLPFTLPAAALWATVEGRLGSSAVKATSA